MYNREVQTFIDFILTSDLLVYNPTRKCIQFDLDGLFKKCFPGIDIEKLVPYTATLLVQKERIKSSLELYTLQEIDDVYFKANKAAWVFNALFGDDVVLNWSYPMVHPPKCAKISADDFKEIFNNSPSSPDDEIIFKEFEMVMDYLVYGILERPTCNPCQMRNQMRHNQTPLKSNIPPNPTFEPTFVERHPECARSVRATPLFMHGYSGRDNIKESLLFGINVEGLSFENCRNHRRPFKSCIPPGEEYMAKHPEQGGLCRVISLDDDNFTGHEGELRSLLDCLKDCHHQGKRHFNADYLSQEEFEKILDQLVHLYGYRPLHPIEKEDEGNVKQDKPKEKPSYGISFYVCHPYKGKYSK